MPFFGILECNFNNILFAAYDLLQKKKEKTNIPVMYLTALE